MNDDILSPLNKQAVAEQALLKFFRENGVFSPPKDNELYYSREQSIRVDMLLHATVKFLIDNHRGDPRPALRLLAEETAEVIRHYL